MARTGKLIAAILHPVPGCLSLRQAGGSPCPGGRGVGPRGNDCLRSCRIGDGLRTHIPCEPFGPSGFVCFVSGRVPLAAGAFLSLLVQRKEPKKHAPGGTPCASLRVRERAGNYVWHIPVPYENAVIHDGALRVLPGPLAVPHGGPERQEQQPMQIAGADAFAFARGAP